MAFANCDVFKVIYFKGTQQQWDVCIPSGLTAIGSGLKYQWYFKKAGASGWSIWNTHTSASTSGTANDSWNGMQVFCLFTDKYGDTASSGCATVYILTD